MHDTLKVEGRDAFENITGSNEELSTALWHHADHTDSGLPPQDRHDGSSVAALLRNLAAEIEAHPDRLIGLSVMGAMRAYNEQGERHGIHLSGCLIGHQAATAAVYAGIREQGERAIEFVKEDAMHQMLDMLGKKKEEPVPLSDLIGENLPDQDIRRDH